MSSFVGARIRSTPDIIETRRGKKTPKIIAIGDLHGDREMFWAIMMASGCVKMKKSRGRTKSPRWIGKNTIIVCLGDTTDSKRPDIKIDPRDEWSQKGTERQLQYDILDLDQLAKRDGGRVFSILGNHDIFAGNSETYCKIADTLNYGPRGAASRRAAYSPGGEMSSIFAETRNVLQVVGPCLFVHGSLVPEFMMLFPECRFPRDVMTRVNSSMKQYLLGGTKKKLPSWFTQSQQYDINPLECRRYGFGDVDTKTVKNFLKQFPGDVRFMFLGHTTHPQITRFGPIICTDVALSRAFGPKQGNICAEWCEIRENTVRRCTFDVNGWVNKKNLKTRR